jgi:hypothetical protein
METIVTTKTYIREETVQRLAWKERPWSCKFGFHHYDEVSADDIQAANQVCTKCGFITHHSAAFMIACIRHRNNHLLVRQYVPQAVQKPLPPESQYPVDGLKIPGVKPANPPTPPVDRHGMMKKGL